MPRPPGATNALPQGSTGSSCSSNPQCNGENATCLTNFFGGYCSQLDCDGSASCLDGNPCLATDPDNRIATQGLDEVVSQLLVIASGQQKSAVGRESQRADGQSMGMAFE